MNNIVVQCKTHGERSGDDIRKCGKSYRCKECLRLTHNDYRIRHEDKIKASQRIAHHVNYRRKRMSLAFPEVYAIFDKVATYFNNDYDKAQAWFQEVNPLLGNVIPKDMVMNGDIDSLNEFVDARFKHE